MAQVPSLDDSLLFLQGIRRGAIGDVEDFLNLSDSLSIYLQDPNVSYTDLEKIAQILQYLNEFTLSLFHEVGDLINDKVAELQSMVEDLEKRNRDVEKRLLDLEIPLLAGQLAYKLEKELVKRILEGTGLEDTKASVSLHALREACHPVPLMGGGIFTDEKQKAIASTNWLRLNESLGLDGDMYTAISELKVSRNAKAHPDLTLDRLWDRLTQEVISVDLLERSKKLIQVLKALGVSGIKT